VSSSQFDVVWSKEPEYVSPITPTSAANVRNFTLVRMDTVEEIPLLSVAPVVGDLVRLRFTRLGAWESDTIVYRVTAADTILAADGSPLVAPKAADFYGMPSVVTQRDDLRPLVDLRNPQSDSKVVNGGLVVTTAGEYQLEQGLPLIRKLIVRRVTSALDSFYHLAGRGYGEGVQPAALYTASDLVLLRASLERAVLKEPEVEVARVSLTLQADGQLRIYVKAKLRRTNQQISLELVPQTTVGAQ
jgi:hypothetical protein